MKNFISLGKFNGSGFIPDKHNFWEILCYVEGSGTIYIDEKAYEFNKGDIFCIPPQYTHKEVGNGEYTNFFVWFEHVDNKDAEIPIYHDTIRGDISKIIEQIFNLYHSENNKKMRIINPLIEAFVQYIELQKDENFKIHPIVEKCIDKIHSNISNVNFDLGIYTENLPISKTHLRAKFKEATGTAPLEYLNFKRIENAKMFLLQTELPIGEISILCGIRDPYYFSRLFKKYIGLSPKDFRLAKKTSF